MPEFKVKDKVIYTPAVSFGTGIVEYVCLNNRGDKLQRYIVVFYDQNLKENFEMMIEEDKLMAKERVRHICPECGVDYADEDMADHLRLEHNIFSGEEHTQAEAELIEMDRIQKLKAEQYDRICEMMFSATGIVEDGDSIKYIIDPETICDELLRIMVEDSDISREKLVETKRRKFKEITLW